MSRSLTEPSEEELEAVRAAQKEMMMMRPDQETLSRQAEEHFTVYGVGAPASIAYLHSLVAKGLGDSYNYTDRDFVIVIRDSDRRREPSLLRARAVTLRYGGGE